MKQKGKDRTKYCHRCNKSFNTLFRVRYTLNKEWYFMCNNCVELEKKKQSPLSVWRNLEKINYF